MLEDADYTLPITRLEFAAVAVKTYENLSGTKALPAVVNPFTDCSDTEVLKAYNLGVVNGMSATTFAPNERLSREQAAAMLTRFLGAEQEALAGDWEHPFTDVPQWAEPYVGWLYESGLTKGVSETVYGAGEDVTCGQYCTFLQRALSDNPLWGQVAAEEEIVMAVTDYGIRIHASVEKNNVFACQFHPEKSSSTGLAILKNFVEL